MIVFDPKQPFAKPAPDGAPSSGPFQKQIDKGLADMVASLQRDAGVGHSGHADTLILDTHCHDLNSDIPDETLGRLLRLPETWLPTADLVKALRRRKVDALAVTNHNNARSCWALKDQGVDVLPAAEFSVTFQDVNVGVHVLTFGLTPQHESALLARRKDAYRFLEYTHEHDLPTSLAHPLHFHSPDGMPSQDLLDRFAVCFERFEGLNGQRNAWQNLLTMEWVKGLTPEKLEAIGRRLNIPTNRYCRDPHRKRLTGGSDCHFGIFAGTTGTALHVPNWRALAAPRSELALQALRTGAMAPFGTHCGEEKLMAAFLLYFCQAALKMEDPGFLRLLLHRGTAQEKVLGYGIANGLLELKRHKLTSRFLQIMEEGLRGRKPSLLTRWLVSKDYRPLLENVEAMAKAFAGTGEAYAETLRQALPKCFTDLSNLLGRRITAKVEDFQKSGQAWPTGADILANLEVPIHFRAWMGGTKSSRRDMASGDLGRYFDGLPFPFLASLVLGGSAFAAASVVHDKRPFVDALADRIGKWKHPHRALWLTDTYSDRNGVSHVLQAMRQEATRRSLPLDFLSCTDAGSEAPGRNPSGPDESKWLALPSSATLRLPFYEQQPLRMPDVYAVHQAFAEGGYDRVICSTEAPMGLLALYLRSAFHVPAYFYVHTDWLDFAKRTVGLDERAVDRLRRLLRAFYSRFDGIFVLNTEQRDFFLSPAMGLSPSRVHLTAHWADSGFKPVPAAKEKVFPGVAPHAKVLLYAGRLSFEKGLRDLPLILEKVRSAHPQAVLAVAGTGPAEAWLRQAIPDAIFLGWQDKAGLARAYSAADLLLLPSWFDTFSCVVLEALQCGLPVLAYSTKGPADIVLHGVNGYLSHSPEAMASQAADYLSHPRLQVSFKAAAIARGADYESGAILRRLLQTVGLQGKSIAGSRMREIPLPPSAEWKVDGILAETVGFLT